LAPKAAAVPAAFVGQNVSPPPNGLSVSKWARIVSTSARATMWIVSPSDPAIQEDWVSVAMVAPSVSR